MRMGTQCRISIMIAVMAALSCGVNASTVTNTLSATQDNHIYQSQPNSVTTAGTGVYFQVKAQPIYSRKAYLDFDISALSGTVTDAALNIWYVGVVTAGIAMPSFSVYGLTGGQTWDESTITWNNAPGNEAKEVSGLNNTSNTVLLATFTVVTNAGKYSVVISSSNIVNYLNWATGSLGDYYGTGVTNDANPTFVITTQYGAITNGLGVQFGSSENPTEAWRPSLTVTTIPEPTTIGLFIISSAGMILFARRCLR